MHKSPTRINALPDWLAWLEQLHSSEIDLGLQRVSAVAERAGLLVTSGLPTLVTVAGTNGKGSVVAMLSAIYRAAGYRVATYTSPHITYFNERICVDGQMSSDRQIVDALSYVEEHRGDSSLTYFEFTTLAAMRLFRTQQIDVAILEVGLGGRLDAVNIWNTDCAAITSIAVDHESWLGVGREVIAKEKVGIARTATPLIVGEADPPRAIEAYAGKIAAQLWQVGQHFDYARSEQGWQINLPSRTVSLPAPALAGAHQFANAATAVTCIEALRQRMLVPEGAIVNGLLSAHVPGRFELHECEGVEIIVDVAHNSAAAKALSVALREHMPGRRAHAVFGIMSDKDVCAVIDEVVPNIASWHCGSLEVSRAMPSEELLSLLPPGIASAYSSVANAFAAALAAAQAATQASAKQGSKQPAPDFVLVFGSFFTVTEIASVLQECH